jgi:hypothetical protein
MITSDVAALPVDLFGESYKLSRVLGSGSFATVRLAKHRVSATYVFRNTSPYIPHALFFVLSLRL